jgi:hypothetical protein
VTNLVTVYSSFSAQCVSKSVSEWVWSGAGNKHSSVFHHTILAWKSLHYIVFLDQ